MNIRPEIVRLIEAIRQDRTHGASELARQAISVLKTATEQRQANRVEPFLSEVKAVSKELMSARPAMAPLYNIVNRWLNAVSKEASDKDPDSLRHLAIIRADELIRSSLQSVERIAACTSALVSDGDRVMTHSYSSTVVAALRESFKQHPHIKTIVTRSGVGRIGEKTAQQLAAKGIPVTFIDDTAIGLYVKQTDKVVVGADRLCADGSLVNGAGTYLVALAADKAGVPFYVLCEMLKFDPRLTGDEVELEEKAPSEVVKSRKLPEEVVIRNPYFDVTPLELITGVVTENGLLTPPEVLRYINRLAAHPG